MYNDFLKKNLRAAFLGGLFLASPTLCLAQGEHASMTAEDCSKDLLLAYFPQPFVNETLQKFNVPQEKWEAINKGLTETDKDVVRLVEEKAAQLNPNPLKDPQQRQVAVKIFRETLLHVFSKTLHANGINDDKQIQAMLDDIQQQKARRFAQCIEKYRPAAPTPEPAGNAPPSTREDDAPFSSTSQDQESMPNSRSSYSQSE